MSQMIELQSNIGSALVKNGDLDNPLARALLATGRCGDLALAASELNGARPVFFIYVPMTEAELAAEFSVNPDVVLHAAHVVLESAHHEDMFVDSFGVHSAGEIPQWFDDAFPVRGTQEMLVAFADRNAVDMLTEFAKSVVELDAAGVGFEYDFEGFSDNFDDEDE